MIRRVEAERRRDASVANGKGRMSTSVTVYFTSSSPKARTFSCHFSINPPSSAWLLGYGQKNACPTLIVAGGQDRLLQPDHARLIHRALPQSELVELPDGAHFIPYQRPAEFAGLVSGLLDRVL